MALNNLSKYRQLTHNISLNFYIESAKTLLNIFITQLLQPNF